MTNDHPPPRTHARTEAERTITHYWAVYSPHDNRWQVLQKARTRDGVNYSISGSNFDNIHVVTAAAADHINRTGKLPQQPADTGEEGCDGC